LVVTQYASAENGANGITHLMGLREPPTAVFLTDPLATVGALRRCLELGIKVPKELSIVGFDDSDVRVHTFPVCTAVVQDARTLGLEAARWLSRLTGGAQDTPERLQMVRHTRFEINQTTAPPPERAVRVLPDGTRVLGEASGHEPAEEAQVRVTRRAKRIVEGQE
jgi:DNA-binding LacI/PurR family transcriptional regulator